MIADILLQLVDGSQPTGIQLEGKDLDKIKRQLKALEELISDDDRDSTPLRHEDFERMGVDMERKLNEVGITTVEDLAEMTPEEIDSLPIRGIGKGSATLWHETAVKLLKNS